ncbi:MAG TPA: hypothetical protein VGB70_10675 [Allosphingosinicella sp.]|jgi:hypothetical protein
MLVASMSAAEPADQNELSTRETRLVIHNYATCVVKQHPLKASEAIQRNVGNAAMMRDYPKLFDGDCLTRSPFEALEARFSGDLYRYAIADALVRRDLADFTQNDFENLPRLDHRDPGRPPSEIDEKGKKRSGKNFKAAIDGYNQSEAFSFLSRYGECVARVNPAAAQALLLTKPDSAEEATRFKALVPAFGTCLPEGQTLSFGKVTLRGTIAVNYYRLATAARAAAATTGTAG